MKIRKLEIELTSKCSLKCRFCLRTNRDVPIKDLDLSLFNKIDMHNITHIDLVGNIGDPIYHSNFLKFIDMVDSKTQIKIATNGSLHQESWWEELAKKLSKNSGSTIVFALDGSEDTHHKHRVGSSYRRLVKNIKAFTSAGGRGHVQFIIFRHNEHEVESVKEVTKDLGCERFIERTSCTYDEVFERPSKKLQTRHEVCEVIDTKVFCYKHLDQNRVFIDSEGNVFPCCYMANCKHDSKKDERVFQSYQKHHRSIDLNTRNIKSIFSGKFYKFVYNNHQNLELCKSFCKAKAENFFKEVPYDKL